jgi:hypothetical protein
MIQPDSTTDMPGVDLKVETYLADPRKLFVDVQMVWPQSGQITRLDPATILAECLRFAEENVVAFVDGGAVS